MGKVGYRCHLCDTVLPHGEIFFRRGTRRVCSDCADAITTEDLLHLTGASSARAMLTALGFERDFI